MNLAASQPSLAEARAKGMAGAEDISNTQLIQFMYACRSTFTNSEDAFYQHQEGLLNDAAFNSLVATVRFSFTSKGYRIAWKRSRDMYGRDFVEFMDKSLAEAPIKLPADRLAQWKVDLIAEGSREVVANNQG